MDGVAIGGKIGKMIATADIPVKMEIETFEVGYDFGTFENKRGEGLCMNRAEGSKLFL